jgi:hypothetical protein
MSESGKSMRRLRLVLGLFVFACIVGHAKNLTVGQPNTPCPNLEYTTITQAINADKS